MKADNEQVIVSPNGIFENPIVGSDSPAHSGVFNFKHS
jgi:hypothetical protein